jgi:dTDP-4-amino-4,6-dideoxygalactose transaminase
MEKADTITRRRLAIWQHYHEAFENLEVLALVRQPVIPACCAHNAHMYYLLLNSLDERTAFIDRLKAKGIGCVFHYVPLHSSSYGMRVGRVAGDIANTDRISEGLVRLPLWLGLEEHQPTVIAEIQSVLRQISGSSD